LSGKVNVYWALYPTGFTVEAYINGATYPREELVQVAPWRPEIVNAGKGVLNRAVLITCLATYA